MKIGQIAAELIIKCLENHNVKYIFGIPGAKVDSIFNALVDSSIELILCRHEQNAAFMAGAYGKLTGEPGVVLVTSGPGVGNLTTGLMTATTEGCPIVAIGGNVARNMLFKQSHQSAKNMQLMETVTKSSKEIVSVDNIPEAISNAFKIAKLPSSGACFLSFPQDVLNETVSLNLKPISHIEDDVPYGSAPRDKITSAIELIKRAKNPIVLLGQEASRPKNSVAIRKFLTKTNLPTISTYQAAGAISKDLVHCFFGRIGLFQNQPADELLSIGDLIITIGFNPAEYDPEIWNSNQNKSIVNIDYHIPDIHNTYQPNINLIGSIRKTLDELTEQINYQTDLTKYEQIKQMFNNHINTEPISVSEDKVHPLSFIHTLKNFVNENTIVSCDIGSIYVWMARYFLSYVPHQLLFSNGQQTLGVGLPWGMAAKLACPNKKIISMSGDGGFLFSATELETAVRLQLDITHFIWVDGSYDMVKEQEMMKYGRKSGVDLNHIDVVKFAESFGAAGFKVINPNDLEKIIKKAIETKGPVLVEIPIDYSDNMQLFTNTNPHEGH